MLDADDGDDDGCPDLLQERADKFKKNEPIGHSPRHPLPQSIIISGKIVSAPQQRVIIGGKKERFVSATVCSSHGF